MFHVYIQKFDVTGNLENFWELNRASAKMIGITKMGLC